MGNFCPHKDKFLLIRCVFLFCQAANTVQAAHPDKPRPNVTTLARMRTDVAVIPTSTGNQLVPPPLRLHQPSR